MVTRKKPCTEADSTVERGLPPAYYQLHALIETLRALQCNEDELCALLAHIRRNGKVGSGVRREIVALLHSIPAMRLHAEMDACFEVLEEAAA
ncbi:MAG TPA: hypothetical protein VGM11_01695 [Acidobacteriaceae bacterium]|jgi:hypothetical protein